MTKGRRTSSFLLGLLLTTAAFSVAFAFHSADLTGDGQVNQADLSVLISQWKGSGSGDLDHDGTVNARDAGILFSSWGTVPPPGLTYYVAKTGSDSHTCTQAQNEATPKLTINATLNCIGTGEGAGAGKTVIVKAGTYEEWVDNNLPGGTSWSAPFTLLSKPGDVVTMRPLVGAGFVLNLRRATTKYAIIDGFIMDGINAIHDVIVITYHSTLGASHHIRVQNSEVKNIGLGKPDLGVPGSQGILVGSPAHSNEFINLDVHDNGASDFDHGLYITGPNNLVENSRIYRNAGWGVHTYNESATIAHNNVIRNNKVYNNARVGKRGPGIGIYSGSGTIAYNNLVWGNNGGIDVNFGASNAKVFNNTVWNNQGGNNASGVCISVGAGSTGASIKNNICWQNKSGISDTGTGTILSNNLFVDPKFVSILTFNFHLLSTSPAINAGTTLPEVPKDFDGVSRPQGAAHDIGAYEFIP